MGIRDLRRKSWMLTMVVAYVMMSLPATASPTASHHSYRLGPNDVVHIQVYGEDDLTVESRVDGDGNINFPLLGIVSVAGKASQELQEYLTTRLAGG